MIDAILNFFLSDKFFIFFTLSCFFLGILGVIDGLWISRYRNLKKMNLIFQGYSHDLGIYINMQVAGSYGLAMLFPKTIGKRLYKNVDYSAVDRKTKWLYMFYPLSLTISFVFMGFAFLLGEAKGL